MTPIQSPSGMVETCLKCGSDDELRGGFCFDCASAGEFQAAKRSVAQHVAKAFKHAVKAKWLPAWYEWTWGWQRLTGTKDYKPGGYFDQEYPGFRAALNLTNGEAE